MRAMLQAGALDPLEAASAKMDYDLECSGYNVRQFLAHVSDQGELGELGNNVLSDILAAVDSIEQDTDAVLDGENEEGWDAFQSKIAVSPCAECICCVSPCICCLSTTTLHLLLVSLRTQIDCAFWFSGHWQETWPRGF